MMDDQTDEDLMCCCQCLEVLNKEYLSEVFDDEGNSFILCEFCKEDFENLLNDRQSRNDWLERAHFMNQKL